MQNMNVSLMEENAIRIKSGITIYVSVIVKIRKTCVQKRLYPATCGCENGKYLASVIDNSVVMCDEIIEKQKLFQQVVLQHISIFYSPFY